MLKEKFTVFFQISSFYSQIEIARNIGALRNGILSVPIFHEIDKRRKMNSTKVSRTLAIFPNKTGIKTFSFRPDKQRFDSKT